MDRDVFSPNGDGVADVANANYSLTEAATVTVQVLQEIVENVGDPKCSPDDPRCSSPPPDPRCAPDDPRCSTPPPEPNCAPDDPRCTPSEPIIVTKEPSAEGSGTISLPQVNVSLSLVRTIETGMPHNGGSNVALWDGMNDRGEGVADGRYRIVVTAQDSSGNSATRFDSVFVDTVSPVALITSPYQQQTLTSNLVEIRGTASDPHMRSYQIEVGEGAAPAVWTLVKSAETVVEDGTLGLWNTFGLTGVWTLRLTVVDKGENHNETSIQVDFGQKQTLIKSLMAEPMVFSPNTDGMTDMDTVRYELTEAAGTTIEIVSGAQIIKTVTTAPVTGTFEYQWDGRDESGQLVADGAYMVRLTATASNDASAIQVETVGVAVDTTAPAVAIPSPAEGAFLPVGIPVVFGSITDAHLASYAVRYSGSNGLETLDAGNQNRANYVFSTLAQIGEGDYQLLMEARDSAGNTATLQRSFKVDHTSPVVTISTPGEGTIFNASDEVVGVSALIADQNLAQYTLKYGSGADPTAWNSLTDILGTASGNFDFSFHLNQLTGSPDGKYTLLVSAKDQAGAETQARVTIEVDRQAPTLSFSNLTDGGYINGPRSLIGTMYDTNLLKGMLEQAKGSCTSAAAWTPLKLIETNIQNSAILEMPVLPDDGAYCAKLWAADRAGNRQEVLFDFTVDTHAPAPPQLAGRLDGPKNIILEWPANGESDLAGYDLYRNDTKLNTVPLTTINYQDLGLAEAQYIYVIKAIDLAGNASDGSVPQTFVVDMTPPVLRILSPKTGDTVGDIVKISGSAFSAADFKEYRAYVGEGSAPTIWSMVRRSPVPINFGTLVEWDTIELAEGGYSIKLEAEDIRGNTAVELVSITVDNTLPAVPVLAPPTVNGSNVALSWTVQDPGNLAGCLLFRNGQLVNYSGTFTANYTPYLLKALTYLDAGVPDGNYSYVAVAVDRAGNMSDQSNAVEVVIETKAPAVDIVEPKYNTRFSDKVLITIKSSDNDVKTVIFQYRSQQETIWHDLSGPVSEQPFEAEFDPGALDLNYGPYYLRAIATDASGKTGAPSVDRYIYYLPQAPKNLTALIDGKKVKLSWTYDGPTAPSSFSIDRRVESYSYWSSANQLLQTSYIDQDVSDGTYYYSVRAVDAFGTKGSELVVGPVQMYSPRIKQPFTPTTEEATAVTGEGAPAFAQVKITNDTTTGTIVIGPVSADADGKFAFQSVALSYGHNRLAAVATDDVGNVRISDPTIVIRATAPSAPTGLQSVVNDHDVALSWVPNDASEQVVGYLVDRDGERLNGTVNIETADVSASWESYNAYRAFDGNISSAWQTRLDIGPQWFELDLPNPEPIARVDIQWVAPSTGKDFDIQAWTGSGWLTLKSVVGNGAETVSVDIGPSYLTDKIRLLLTGSNDTSSYRYVLIREISLQKDELTAVTTYDDRGLADKEYAYSLRAVNNLGLISVPSSEIPLVVGDVVPPAAPISLVVSTVQSTVQLDWGQTPNSETDLAGYNVYRLKDESWQKLNSALVTAISFADHNLPNGTYSYRVTAVDLVGNEGEPSPEAQAIVALTAPQSPHNLVVSAVPEGSALALSWTVGGGGTTRFHVYRGSISGGPYQKVNGTSLMANAYTDTGLVNGQTYYYVITSVDTGGNESDYSAETSGAPSDRIAPAAPILMYPATSGMQVSTMTALSQISGLAEPGSNVSVYLAGTLNATVSAAAQEIRDIKSVGLARQLGAISPDGSKLCYVNNKQLVVLNLTTNESITIASYVLDFAWSPDGKKIAYQQTDSGLYYNYIYIYDLDAKTSTHITNESWSIERHPSWSADGGEIVFANQWGGLFVKDLVSGELIQLLNGSNITWPKLSPDGTKVIYFQYGSLYLRDLTSGESRLVDYYTDEVSSSWSADGRQIAYVSLSGTTHGLTVYEFGSQEKRQIASGTSTLSRPTWSPDGLFLAFGEITIGSNATVRIVDVEGTSRVAQDGLIGLHYLKWRPTGEMQIVDSKGVYTIYPAGFFKTKEIALDVGENVFYAFAEDPSGNRSMSSEAISVVYDISQLPDLSVALEDMSVYPASLLPGGMGIGHIVVRNLSSNPVTNAKVDVYLWDSDGQFNLLDEVLITQLPAHSSQSLNVSLQAGTQPGVNRMIVVVDPEGTIAESIESNNYTIREFTAAARTGIVLNTATDREEYASNEDVGATVKVECFADEQVSIEFKIEDVSGNVVRNLDGLTAALMAGITTYSYNWNTGITLAGSYKFHAVISNSTGSVQESYSDFTILPDLNMRLESRTDKPSYRANEAVNIGTTITHDGWNAYIENLKIKVSIVNSSNSLIASEEKILGTLFPRTSSQVPVPWNTGLTVPGSYQVFVEASDNSKILATDQVGFIIEPSAIISGVITNKSEIVLAGTEFIVGYHIENSGNAGISGILHASVVDSKTLEVRASAEKNLSLTPGTGQSGEFTFSSQELLLQSYLVVLKFTGGSVQKTIGSASFIIRDGTPPVMTVLSPQAGESYDAGIPLTIRVADEASGVARVEYQLNAGEWLPLPLADPSNGRYSLVWEPALQMGGTYNVRFRAIDQAGNSTESGQVEFEVQMDKIPPVTTIIFEGPHFIFAPESTFLSNQTDINLTAADDASGIARSEYRIDTGPWQAFSSKFNLSVLAEGEHRLWYRSADHAGNVENDRGESVFIDNTAPSTEITFNDQRYLAGEPPLVSSETEIVLNAADLLSGVRTIEYRFDDEPSWRTYYGAFRLTDFENGNHTIHYRSVDNVENAEEKAAPVFLANVKVATEILNLPRVLIWTRDPAEITGNDRPAYSLDDIRALAAEAFIQPDAYFTVSTEKEEFRQELRSGVYNMVMILDHDFPFDAVFLREMREAVYRGTGLMISHWQKSVDPILQDLFGVDFNGSLPMKAETWPVMLFESPLSAGQSLSVRDRVLKTRLNGGTLAGIIPGESACSGIDGLSLNYPVELQIGDRLTVSLSVPQGQKFTLIDEEQTIIEEFPVGPVNNFSGQTGGDLLLSGISPDGVSLSLSARYDYLGEAYSLSIAIDRPDGSFSKTGPVPLTPTCGANLQAGRVIGPLTLNRVDEDRVRTSEDLPAVVMHRYGLGRTIFLSYNLIGSALNGERGGHVSLLRRAATFLLPESAELQAGGVALVETVVGGSAGLDLKVVEKLGEGLTLLFSNTMAPLEFVFPKEAAEHRHRYFVRAADRAGTYAKETEVLLGRNGNYTLIDRYPFSWEVDSDSALHLQQATVWVEEQKWLHPEAAQELTDIGEVLDLISSLPKGNQADMEKAIHHLLQLLQRGAQLPFEARDLRNILTEVIRIMAGESSLLSGAGQAEFFHLEE